MLSFAGLLVLVSHHLSLSLSPIAFPNFSSSFNFLFFRFIFTSINHTHLSLLPFLLRLGLISVLPFLFSITPAIGGSVTRFSTLHLFQALFEQKKRKMNHCGIHQNNTFASSCEEMRGSVSVSVSFDNGEPMVCPKPRRLSLFSTTNESVRPLRWQMCYQSEGYESKAGPELLDIIFAKGGGYGASEQTCTQVASSPPFFSGSPPSRVSNPLIQDARFGDDKISPVSPRSMIPNPASSGMSSSSPSSSARKGGCLRANFGNKPAVRIEGFDCLDRDNRRNCSIPALA